MHRLRFDEISVGDKLPGLEMGPISRLDLALYAGASGDHNPIHIDIDFARAAGMDDVFAQGMLVMAYLGRTLTAWTEQPTIREFSTRFVAITHIADRISCQGQVVEKVVEDDQKQLRVALTATDQSGEVKATASALVILP